MSLVIRFFLLFAALLSVPAAATTYTPVALPSLNADIRTFTDGATYNPLFTGSAGVRTETFLGVPFEMRVDNAGNTAFLTTRLPDVSLTITLAQPIFGATAVHTLINSTFGTYPYIGGYLAFQGSNGANYQVPLVQGFLIRDHYDGGYNNVISGGGQFLENSVTQVFGPASGGARLDMQTIGLPAQFATQNLTQISFFGECCNGGNPFLVGATVAAVPEPGAPVMFGLGAGLLAWAVRRRSRSAVPNLQ